MSEPSYRLPCYRRFAYSIGHVLNDLCASIWFSYLLVFFHKVLNFSNENSGLLLLLGQVADAIATPLVGYESDRIEGCCKYTKRKSWHLLGTICVAATFPFIFLPCFTCETSADWARFIYYAPFIIIFQFGWASTQISHLSLIPELTPNDSERVELNAIRYAFTVCSNIAVYVLAWRLLASVGTGTDLGPEDSNIFKILVLSVVVAGLVFSAIFHIFTQERRNDDVSSRLLSRLTSKEKMRWQDWLREHQFYMIAFLYMCTRLIVNVSQIYLPMYLTESLSLPKQYIATVPLAVFVSGFLTSFVMRWINQLAGRKLTYLFGILMVLGSVTWMFFLRHATDMEVFGAAILLGAGGSTILVTSLSMTADLIGDRTESGAFVYGAMSFTDKLSNGIAVAIIQRLHPCKATACCPACTWFYRDMIVFVPGGVAIAALVCLIIIAPQKIGFLKKSVGKQAQDSESESSSLLGESGSKERSDSGSDLCGCSYLCCVSLSRDAQDHKVALCATCGRQDCVHHSQVIPGAHLNYGSTSQQAISHSENSENHVANEMGTCASGGELSACASERELNTCASGRPMKSCAANNEMRTCASENEMKTCAAEGEKKPPHNTESGLQQRKPITVSVDVHA